MSLRHIVKVLVPALLFITTFFPVYEPLYGTQAVNLYQLVADLPVAAIVPLIFFASILCAFAGTKWLSRFSAVLAVLGMILTLVVIGHTDLATPAPKPYASILVTLYMFVVPVTYVSLLVSSIMRRRYEKQKHKKDKAAPLLAMSPKRLVVFMAVSFGFYSLYWFYQNWKAIRAREGRFMMPFWRAFFSVIWVYPLFKRIIGKTGNQVYRLRFSAQGLAEAYIFVAAAAFSLSFLLKSPWLLLLAGFGSLVGYTLVLLVAQQIINTTNFRQPSPSALRRKVTKGEVAVVLIGIALMAFSIFAVFNRESFYVNFYIKSAEPISDEKTFRDTFLTNCVTQAKTGLDEAAAHTYCSCALDRGLEMFGVEKFIEVDQKAARTGDFSELSGIITECAAKVKEQQQP